MSLRGSYQPVARNDVEPTAVLKREVAWQKMSGEVFRKPQFPIFFSVLVGGGVQMLMTLCLVFLFNMFTLYTPISITWWLSLLMGMFPFMGIINGYVSARMYKFFNGTNWLMLSWMAFVFVSGFFAICLGLIYMLEFLETKKIVFSEILLVIFAWLAVNCPSTLAGTYLGFKQTKFDVVNKPTRLARKKAKETTCFLNPVLCFLFSSVIPFMVFGLQFYYVFSSVSGGNNINILYWSIYLTFIALMILIAEVSIIHNYVGLCYG